MAFIKKIEPRNADGPLRSEYDAAEKRAGGVAQIIQVMSRDARSCSASMAFYVSLIKSDNPLPAAQREMLATVVSTINDCYY